jgi:hypothetical protein
VASCDWVTVEAKLSLAAWLWLAVLFWFPDWLIDWSTVASPNACCGCGIAPPNPIKDIADSSTAAVANIASLGHFWFLFPEFPVERRLIVGVHTLMVNMKCGVVFSIKIQNLKPNFIVMKKLRVKKTLQNLHISIKRV